MVSPKYDIELKGNFKLETNDYNNNNDDDGLEQKLIDDNYQVFLIFYFIFDKLYIFNCYNLVFIDEKF